MVATRYMDDTFGSATWVWKIVLTSPFQGMALSWGFMEIRLVKIINLNSIKELIVLASAVKCTWPAFKQSTIKSA